MFPKEYIKEEVSNREKLQGLAEKVYQRLIDEENDPEDSAETMAKTAVKKVLSKVPGATPDDINAVIYSLVRCK